MLIKLVKYQKLLVNVSRACWLLKSQMETGMKAGAGCALHVDQPAEKPPSQPVPTGLNWGLDWCSTGWHAYSRCFCCVLLPVSVMVAEFWLTRYKLKAAEIQTHKRFKRMLIYYDTNTQSCKFLGVIPSRNCRGLIFASCMDCQYCTSINSNNIISMMQYLTVWFGNTT